jgi:hypothetical protein
MVKKKNFKYAVYKINFEKNSNQLKKAAFVTFLIMFSYFIMTQFNFTTTVYLNKFESSFNSSNFTNHTLERVDIINHPSVFEYILAVWVFSLALEEARQFFSDDIDVTIDLKVIRYFRGRFLTEHFGKNRKTLKT